MEFWLVLLSMALIAGFMVARPLLSTQADSVVSRTQVNAILFKDRLVELQGDLDNDRINQQAYDQLKLELEQTLLADVQDLNENPAEKQSKQNILIAALAFLMIPIISLSIYGVEGTNEHIQRWMAVEPELNELLDAVLAGKADPEAAQQYSMIDFIHALQRKAQSEGDNPVRWFQLGVTYLRAESPQFAEVALRRAHYLDADNSEYAIAHAQSLMALNQGALTAESERLLREVIDKNPNQVDALMMLAMGAFASGNYEGAIQGWTELLSRGNGEGEGAKILERSIAMARQRLAATNTVATPNGEDSMPVSESPIVVSVDIVPELAASLQGGEYLMVYAQAATGLPMPLAIVKQRIDQWPATFSLSDAQAMAPAFKLSSFEEWVVTARVSKTGSAKTVSGDFLVKSNPLQKKQSPHRLSLLIDTVAP